PTAAREQRSCDYKSAIQQIKNLGYERSATRAEDQRQPLLYSVCLPNPEHGLHQADTPALVVELPGQLRGILPCQFIQARNPERFERRGISNPHPFALSERHELPHSVIKRRIYFSRPLLQFKELISTGGVSLAQGVYSRFSEFLLKMVVYG